MELGSIFFNYNIHESNTRVNSFLELGSKKYNRSKNMEDLLGRVLENERKSRNLSLRQVAEEIGISHTELRRIESGVRKNIDDAVLMALLKLYNLKNLSRVRIDGKNYRIFQLIHNNSIVDPPKTPSSNEEIRLFAGLTGQTSSDYELKCWSILEEWLLKKCYELPDTVNFFGIPRLAGYRYVINHNQTSQWMFDFKSGNRDSRKLVMDTYYQLLTSHAKPDKVSIVTSKQVIFNAFLNRPAYNFSFELSVILIDFKKGIVAEEITIGRKNLFI